MILIFHNFQDNRHQSVVRSDNPHHPPAVGVLPLYELVPGSAGRLQGAEGEVLDDLRSQLPLVPPSSDNQLHLRAPSVQDSLQRSVRVCLGQHSVCCEENRRVNTTALLNYNIQVQVVRLLLLLNNNDNNNN